METGDKLKNARFPLMTLLVFSLVLFMSGLNPTGNQLWVGSAEAATVPCPVFTSPGGNCVVESYAETNTLMKTVCDYKKNTSSYKKVALKGFTDCYGLLVTALRKTKIDSSAPIWTMAYLAPNYFSKNKSKYEVIKGVKSTKKLKPGDMLFSTKFSNSHANMYVGPGYCGCKGGVISASLGSHGPECDPWTSKMSTVVRLKPKTGTLTLEDSDIKKLSGLLATLTLNDFEGNK